MKKRFLIPILVFVLVLFTVLPAFADPGNGKSCDHIWGSGHSYGWFMNWDAGKGWGPQTQWIGYHQACLVTATPKTPYWAGP